MTQHAETAEHPTPGPVLAGVVALGLAALLSVPSPFFTGLLLVPAFGASAVLGYRRVPWAGFLGLAASAAALLIALVAAVASISQPTAVSTLLAAFGALLVGLCALVGGVASGVLVMYRHRLARASDRPSGSPQPPATYPSSPAPEQDATQPARASSQRRDDDFRRVGRATATGARALAAGGAAAWRTQRRRAAAREERGAREAAARGPSYFSTRAMDVRKRDREDAEIRKAQVAQARRYNNRH